MSENSVMIDLNETYDFFKENWQNSFSAETLNFGIADGLEESEAITIFTTSMAARYALEAAFVGLSYACSVKFTPDQLQHKINDKSMRLKSVGEFWVSIDDLAFIERLFKKYMPKLYLEESEAEELQSEISNKYRSAMSADFQETKKEVGDLSARLFASLAIIAAHFIFESDEDALEGVDFVFLNHLKAMLDTGLVGGTNITVQNSPNSVVSTNGSVASVGIQANGQAPQSAPQKPTNNIKTSGRGSSTVVGKQHSAAPGGNSVETTDGASTEVEEQVSGSTEKRRNFFETWVGIATIIAAIVAVITLIIALWH